MPRPADTYTHSQFEPIFTDNRTETVRCVHCQQWSGSVRVLSRKKEHLLKCPAYAAWREAGNGQELQPPNNYTKRPSEGNEDENVYASPYATHDTTGPQYTPTMGKGKNPDVSKSYDEFWDDSNGQKCMRVRCRHCGFVRARNTTRQIEHLLQCKEFLNSSEGQAAAEAGQLATPEQRDANGAQSNVWRGQAPNPNLVVHRRGQHKTPRNSNVGPSPLRPAPPPSPKVLPSLVNHLLSREPTAFTTATQQPFLSHAGCGTLSPGPLLQWLAQDSHISRGFISFIGQLMSKIRLPETSNSQQNTSYRALDLLISAMNNVRREMTFFEATQQKYGLQLGGTPPKPATKGYLDLFASAAAPGATLLEGMCVLWATEHCYRTSWHYASTFTSTMPASNYSLPSYLTQIPSQHDLSNPYGARPPTTSDNTHISALHQALIPNWTSPAFSKFVDACRAIVDELANAETTGNGRETMQRCEGVFRQVVWLWERIWPDVDGMGEADELANESVHHPNTDTTGGGKSTDAAVTEPSDTGANGRQSNQQEPIEIADDAQEDPDRDAHGEAMDSPYGGTGLGAVHAANQTA